jgi:CHAT domain-containing protein/tetratricopeptide (TPR) repeat protein
MNTYGLRLTVLTGFTIALCAMPVTALAGKLEDLEEACKKDLAHIEASKDLSMVSKESGEHCLAFLQEAEKSNDESRVLTGRLSVGALFMMLGRRDEAMALLLKAFAALKELPNFSLEGMIDAELKKPKVEGMLDILSELLRSEHRYADAERLYRHALAIEERELGSTHVDVGFRLHGLAGFLTPQDKHAEAAAMLERAISILEKSFGPDSEAVLMPMDFLAVQYGTLGRYQDAEIICRRTLASREKTNGPNHTLVAKSLDRLAFVLKQMERTSETIPIYRRALAIEEKHLGLENPEVANSLDSLAEAYISLGQYPEAELLYRRALAIREKSFGSEYSLTVGSLIDLANLYHSQKKHVEAESLFREALKRQEKGLRENDPAIANTLVSLSRDLSSQGRYPEAESALRRALAIHERLYGQNGSWVAHTLTSIAFLYSDQKRYSDAEPLLRRALSIDESIFGKDHPNVAIRLEFLADNIKYQERFGNAELLYLRVVNILGKSFGKNYTNLATVYQALYSCYLAQGKTDDALGAMRKATSFYRQRLLTGTDSAPGIPARQTFTDNLMQLASVPWSEAVFEETFQLNQLLNLSGTGKALAIMAARVAKGDGDLAVLVRTLQDVKDRKERGEESLVKAAMLPGEKRNIQQEQSLREENAELEKRLALLKGDMATRFPEFDELTSTAPITIAETLLLLEPDEALITYSIANQMLLWVIRPGHAALIGLGVSEEELKDVAKDEKALADLVEKIRRSFDPYAANLMAIPGTLAQLHSAMPVDAVTLHKLYQLIFAPALPSLQGVKHVFVVPVGPLQSLPFATLVASPPPANTDGSEYGKIDWLAKHYAFTTLPSASSLRALRKFAKGEAGKEPFTGFGDPLLNEMDESSRGKRRNLAAAIKTTNAGLADGKRLREAGRLPDTAAEIETLASTLGAPKNSIWLQGRATETNLKSLDLTRYQTLAFATHGALAGEVAGISEPGLILTPPSVASDLDDGYLSASEIAQLKLNAEWIILSACNTAAGDGSPGAEGLSGLAKAFFYAGSRTLFVSHWPVESAATVKLTTRMLRFRQDNPKMGKAEAHRQSMLELMTDKEHPEYAHPMFWAPFVVVGEGGVDRSVRLSAQPLGPQSAATAQLPKPSTQKTIQEHCADRPNFISRWQCEHRFCKRPEWIDTPSCAALNGQAH